MISGALSLTSVTLTKTLQCLCEFVAVIVVGDVVSAQCVTSNIRIKGALQREARTRGRALGYFHGDVCLRKARRVVVDVHHLYLHPKELEWVLQEHLQVKQTAGALLTDALPVDFLVNEKHPVLQVYFQVRRPRAGYHLKSQILGDIPNKRAMLRFLGHRVTSKISGALLRGPLAQY
uniref:Uncharacterized protein n=2 Tax=Cyprinus carpio TaxID=7962 RepID=A0A8C1LFK9_CYPCA